MKKVKTKGGHVAYSVTRSELILIGGLGICDHCNHTASTGYLIPVLNYWICSPCFKQWDARGTFYPEDLPYEQSNCQYYETVLHLEVNPDDSV